MAPFVAGMNIGLGSGVGDDYIAYCRRREVEQRERFAAAEARKSAHQLAAKAGGFRKEGTVMPRGYQNAPKFDKLDGFALYEPPRNLPQVGLNMLGDLTLPPSIAAPLGDWVQISWSLDRKALAIKACAEISPGAVAVWSATEKRSARVKLAPALKHFRVRVLNATKYGAEVSNGLLILALTGIEIAEAQ